MNEFLTQYRPRFKEVRYEVLCDPLKRSEVMSDLCQWLDLSSFADFNFTQKRMASSQTGSERWRARSGELEQVLCSVPGGAQLQERLAYE